MRFLILLLALLWLVESAAALDLSGQYTNLLFETRDSLNSNRITDLNRLRLKLEGEQGPFHFHLAYDHELLWGGMVSDPVISEVLGQPDPTWMDAGMVLSRRSRFHWRHTLYRGWLEYDAGGVIIKVGRQRIAWGSGRIWNPTDRFNPVQPTALEPEQKLGVDAAVLQWNYTANGSLLAVAAPARSAYQTSRKLALRWQDTFDEFDIALMAGRINDENIFGFDFTGNLGDAAVRLEWMQAKNPLEGGYGQLATGIDYTWSHAWFPNGLYLAIEYFYNGADGSSLRTLDRLSSQSNHLLGGILGYDLASLWHFNLLLITDLKQYSWFAVPSLTWSAAKNVDVRLFVQLPQGSAGGEFTRFEPLYAVRTDWYF
jgi:hypothetical protein